MGGRFILAGLLSAASALAAVPAGANDDAIRALGLGLSILNSMQQQQQQQPQRQQQPQQQRQQATQRPAPTAAETAAAREQREAIKQAQALLNRLGYDAGPVDGDPGPRTRNAIAQFRADYGLMPGTGVDPELTGALRVAGRNAPAVAGGGERQARATGAPRRAPEAVDPPLWDEPEGQLATLGETGGFLSVDGRIAIGGESAGKLFKGGSLTSNLNDLLRAYTLSMTPDPLGNDEAAFSALLSAPEPVAVEILEAAYQRPLKDYEVESFRRAQATNDSFAMSGVLRMSSYEYLRALEAIRARADLLLATDLPELPVPVRVYCTISFGEYDISSRAFPIRSDSCASNLDGLQPVAEAGGVALAERLPLPPAEAEQFELGLGKSKYRMLASYDAMLDIDVRDLDSARELLPRLSGRENWLLYRPGTDTEVLLALSAPSGKAAPTAGAGRAWDLEKEADLLEFAGLAGAPVRFPLDGAALLADEPVNLGTLAVRGDYIDAREPRPSEPFRKGGGQLLETVAAALAVPRDRIVSLANTGDSNAAMFAVGLLPAPTAAYGQTPPADFYGRHRIEHHATLGIAGATLIDLGGQSLLVVRLAPIEASFEANDGSRSGVLERFDLAAVPPVPIDGELLPVPSNLALYVRAADAVGADPREGLLGFGVDARADEFEQRDHAEALVAEARADTGPNDRFWVAGTATYGEYDHGRQIFPAGKVTLGPINVLRAGDLPGDAIDFATEKVSLDLSMAPDEARAWRAAHRKGEEIPYRALVTVTGAMEEYPNPRIAITVERVELLDEAATPTRRDPAHVIRVFDFGNAEATAVAAAPAAAPEPRFDIMGLKLGTPADAAVASFTADFVERVEYQITRDLAARLGRAPVKAWDSFRSAQMYYDPARRVGVALYSEPPTAADKVTALLRIQTFEGEARPHPDAIEQLLIGKYGQPLARKDTEGLGRLLVWFSIQDAEGKLPLDPMLAAGCPNQVMVPLSNGSHNVAQGQLNSGFINRATPWFDLSGAVWEAPDGRTLDLAELAPPKECGAGEVVAATILVDPDGLVRNFQVALFDGTTAASLALSNQAAAEAAAPRGAQTLDIKL